MDCSARGRARSIRVDRIQHRRQPHAAFVQLYANHVNRLRAVGARPIHAGFPELRAGKNDAEIHGARALRDWERGLAKPWKLQNKMSMKVNRELPYGR